MDTKGKWDVLKNKLVYTTLAAGLSFLPVGCSLSNDKENLLDEVFGIEEFVEDEKNNIEQILRDKEVTVGWADGYDALGKFVEIPEEETVEIKGPSLVRLSEDSYVIVHEGASYEAGESVHTWKYEIVSKEDLSYAEKEFVSNDFFNMERKFLPGKEVTEIKPEDNGNN